MSGRFTMIIEHDDYGYFAYCPELSGCHTQGDSYEDASKNLKEAISLYLETLSHEEKEFLFKKEIQTSFHEVELV